MIYEIMVWSALALGLVPTARRISRHLAQRRPAQGAHAKLAEPAEPALAGPEAADNRREAITSLAIPIICAFVVIAKPHGLAYWLPLGGVVVILLWEPFHWLTAYLIRKANQQDAT